MTAFRRHVPWEVGLMHAGRFDRLSKALADRSTRRGVVLGGLSATVAALMIDRLQPRGVAQGTGSPVASPNASPAGSPGPLDVLAGTPPTGGDPLGRLRECKKSGAICAEPNFDNGGRASYYDPGQCCLDYCQFVDPPMSNRRGWFCA